MIQEAFLNGFGKKLGFFNTSLGCGNLMDNIKAIEKDDFESKQYIVDVKYRQNAKVRLWETIYIHNKGIIIPEEMCLI